MTQLNCEEILPNLIESFKKGIHYADPILDLDAIAFPDIELLNKYPWRKDTAWVLTSRGCPNQCSYCQKFFGDRVRLRSVANILGEINRYGDKMIEIIDDAFTIDKARVYDFCEHVPKINYRLIALSNGTIATTLNEEMVEALARVRLTNMMIGLESIDRQVLKLAKRNIYREDCEKVIKWCKKNNITIGVFMIIGLPGSSFESDIKSIQWLSSQNVFASYGVPIPFKNTFLWDWVNKNGKWLTNPLDYEDYPPKFEMDNYPGSKIQEAFEFAQRTRLV